PRRSFAQSRRPFGFTTQGRFTMKAIALGVGIGLVIGSVAASAQNAGGKVDFIHLGKDAALTPVALWVEGGKPKVARGPDAANAPKDAAKITLKSFDFEYGGNMREAHLPKGTKYTPPGGHLTVIYVKQGHLRVTENGVTGDVMPGDTIAEYDGRP